MSRDSYFRYVLFSGISITFLFHIAFLFTSVNVDGGAFLTIGAGVLEGKIPYVDYIDHKPPGIYYFLALVLSVGRSALLAKLSIFLVNISTALLLFWAISKELEPKYAYVSVLLYMIGLLVYAGYHILTEPLVALCSTIGFLLVTQFRDDIKYISLAGLFIGGATLFKQPGIVIAGAIIVYLWITSSKCRSRHLIPERIRSIVAFTAGFSIPITVASLYFFSIGEFSELVRWALVVNLPWGSYGQSAFDVLDVVKEHKKYLLYFPLVWALAIVGGWTTLSSWEGAPELLRGAFVVQTILLPVLIMDSSRHTYIMFLPFVSILATYSLREACKNDRWSETSTIIKRLVIVLLLVTALPATYQISLTSYSMTVENNIQHDRKVANFVEERTEPNERILVCGGAPKYYFLANRDPPGKNIYYYEANADSYSKESLDRAVRTNNIKYMIVNSYGSDGFCESSLSGNITELTKIGYKIKIYSLSSS